MARSKNSDNNGASKATKGLEETLWQAADKQRGHMDAAEYKHSLLVPKARKADNFIHRVV